MEILQKIESYIKEYHMIEAGSHVIAGVSGGADSVCLLLALLKLRGRLGHTVSVVHVEHGIRGEEALQDAAFVKQLCWQWGIACRVCHCKAPAYAAAHGISVEEAGRLLRYAFFEDEKKVYEARAATKIAVAHHMGDQAETVLFHLARGTGIRGLAGMEPVRGDIIRPLLAVSRVEIEACLARYGQGFCTDRTNESDDYSRNKIRHAVLPVLGQVNSRAIAHIGQVAEQLREVEAYLKKQADLAAAACCVWQGDGVCIDKDAFEQAEPVLRAKMLHQILGRLCGSSRDFTKTHISQLLALFERQNSRRLELPYGIQAVRVYGGIEIFQKQGAGSQAQADKQALEQQFSFRVLEDFSYNLIRNSKKTYTKCFDYDKIKAGFQVRYRQPGDYLEVDRFGNRQKLKKYLVNEKIPVKEREQLLLLADGAHIMWIVGYRISNYYKVDEHTRRVLEVTFYGGKGDGWTDSCNDSGRGSECKDR